MKLEEYDLPNWNKFKIKQSIVIGDTKILILEWLPIEEMAIVKEGMRNLLAIDLNTEKILWVAKMPKMYPNYGVYDPIEYKEEKLWAWCGNILCEINPNNGEIISEEFVK